MTRALGFGAVFLVLASIAAGGCAKTAARAGEACNSTDGCEGAASCVAGTCFLLCASSTDCPDGECRTFTNTDSGREIKACSAVDGGVARSSSSSSSGGGSGNGGTLLGSGTDTCYDAPLCNGHVVKSCATPSKSCYYLVDGATTVPCASNCNCQAAAQQIVSSNCH